MGLGEGSYLAEAYLNSIRTTDPASALAWANSIAAPEPRVEMLAEVAGAWRGRDAHAATRAVAGLDLPDDQKARVAAALENDLVHVFGLGRYAATRRIAQKGGAVPSFHASAQRRRPSQPHARHPEALNSEMGSERRPSTSVFSCSSCTRCYTFPTIPPGRSGKNPPAMKAAILAITAAALAFAAGWFLRAVPSAVPQARPTTAAGTALPTADSATTPPFGPAPISPDLTAEDIIKRFGTRTDLAAKAGVITYASGLDLAQVQAASQRLKNTEWGANTVDAVLRDALLERWAELDVESLIEVARTNSRSTLHYKGLAIAFATLAKSDSRAAWERSDQLGGNASYYARSGVIEQLKSTDPHLALSLLAESPDRQSNNFARQVLSEWVSRDPAAATAATEALPRGELRTTAIDSLAQSWSQRDFTAAFAWAGGLQNPADRVQALTASLNALASEDPERAFQQLEGTDLGSNRDHVLSTIVQSMAVRDVDRALTFALDRSTFRDKAASLSSLAENLNAEDTEKVLSAARDLPPHLAKSIYTNGIWRMASRHPDKLPTWLAQIPQASVREEISSRAVQNLSWYDPEAALKLFGQLQPGSQQENTAGYIAANLANNDPEAALKWAAGLTNTALRKQALASTFKTWADTDPTTAAAQLKSITDLETRTEITRSLAAGIAGRSLKEAEQWARKLTGTARSAALGAVVQNAAQADPTRAPDLYAEFAKSLSADDTLKSENHKVAATVAKQIAQTDPQQAITWANALPEGGARDEAIGSIAGVWAAYDPYATSGWLHDLPAGKGRDLATLGLVGTIARDDPDSAWAWTTTISDPAQLRQAATNVLQYYKSNGRLTDAVRALQSADLPEATRTELAKTLE
ncbi:hypothetical protein BH23VER1_BH23VER1_04300 [soil metagenome]